MKSRQSLTWTIIGSLGFAFVLLSGSCKSKEKLPSLGDKVSGPIDVATAPNGKLFYALNSDYQRRFNEGSLQVIDSEPADGSTYKIATIPTRRLGQTMHVAQNLLLITYDHPEKTSEGYAELWSLANEAQPALLVTWELQCAPVNAIIAPTRPYLAVSCATGQIYLGTWSNSTPAGASLDLVRNYGFEHRALYFYESTKTWLLGFPSDSGDPRQGDLALVDKLSFEKASEKLLDKPNTVPDVFESTAANRRRASQTLPFQMFVYNLSDEEAASAAAQAAGDSSFVHFRNIALGGTYTDPTLANQELNYVSYVLRELNGQPNSSEGTAELYSRSYRTNFYDAKPDFEGRADTFYLSQRGKTPGSAGNSILKLRIDESVLNRILEEKVPFEQIFSVERIYGYEPDRDTNGRYPGDFELLDLDGEPMVIINHFRDVINFSGATFYGITRKLLSESHALDRPESADSTAYQDSYFQIAASPSGKVLTASFYGDALFLFDAHPRISIKDQIPTRIE